jgi:hypothetical protein
MPYQEVEPSNRANRGLERIRKILRKAQRNRETPTGPGPVIHLSSLEDALSLQAELLEKALETPAAREREAEKKLLCQERKAVMLLAEVGPVTESRTKPLQTPPPPPDFQVLHGIPGTIARLKPERLARNHDHSKIEALINEL